MTTLQGMWLSFVYLNPWDPCWCSGVGEQARESPSALEITETWVLTVILCSLEKVFESSKVIYGVRKVWH